MASYIGQIKIGTNTYPVGSLLYGTCTTEDTEPTKIVDLDNFDTLTTGITVHVKFTNTNKIANPTLKVGTTDAKPIMQYGSTPASTATTTSWRAGAVVPFTYDGTNWLMNSAFDANTTYSVMSQADATAGTATTGRLISAKVLGDTITGKINELDVTDISGFGTGKTLKTLSESDGLISATFQDISITKSQVSDLGTIGAAAAKGVDTSISDGSTSTNLPTTAAVVNYIDGTVSGLTGAMHLIGTTTTAITDGSTTASVVINSETVTPKTGDVVLYDNKEFVWDGTSWELLGDEGSYALKSSTASVGSASGWSAGSVPSLGKTDVSIPNVTNIGSVPSLGKTDVSIPNVTSAGSATTASVANGTLTISIGSAPTLGTAISATKIDSWSAGSAPTLGTAISATKIDSWSAGSAPALTVSPTTVVVP